MRGGKPLKRTRPISLSTNQCLGDIMKICFILTVKTWSDAQAYSTRKFVYQTWSEVSSYVAKVLGYDAVKDLDIFEDVLSEKSGVEFNTARNQATEYPAFEAHIQPASLRG
jgi:hypothetical protein